jgi:catechol 2,3-dioxygenase-like lactoylglutathione lyase family enzyme
MRFATTVVGSADPRALADFYQQLLGWDRVADEPFWVRLAPPGGGTGLSFQYEPDFVRPVWPPKPGEPQMTMHLDLDVDDVDASVAWAQATGAVLAEHQPEADVRVLFDPAGHPFCIFNRAEQAAAGGPD